MTKSRFFRRSNIDVTCRVRKALIVCFVVGLSSFTAFAGDSGYYQIFDSSNLRELADYVNAGNSYDTRWMYYILINDIDLNGYKNIIR